MPRPTSATIRLVGYSDNGATATVELSAKARPGSRILSWSIDWNDGAPVTFRSAPLPSHLSHTYSSDGNRIITLTVTDSRFNSAEDSVPASIKIANSNSTVTLSALELSSTFDSISLRVQFSDPSLVATASIQFKPTSGSSWFNAYEPIADRRTFVNSQLNPYVNQFRGSIVGLGTLFPPGTAFDVRVVSEGTVIQGSVSTLTTSVPLGGGTFYYDASAGDGGNGSFGSPWNNIATAQAGLSPGDTLIVRPSTSAAFTWTKSGTAGAWILVQGENRDTCLINGGTVDLTISANYVKFQNLRLKKPTAAVGVEGDCVRVSTNNHHVMLDNFYCEDLQHPSSAGTYDNASVRVHGGAHNVYLLNSTLLCPSLDSKPDKDFDIGGFGFSTFALGTEGTVVVKGCTITGKFQDSVGSSEAIGGNQWNNSDILDNVISGFSDEGIQCEGDSINVRIGNNRVTCGNGFDPVGQGPGWYGPSYLYRNLLVISLSTAANAFKFGGNAYPHIFHNTIDNAGVTADLLAGAGAEGIRCRNNIFLCSNADMLYLVGKGGSQSESNRFDYNLYYRVTNLNIVFHWNNNAANDYDTVAQFYSGTLAVDGFGQEEHGISGSNPNLQGSLRTILSSSPAYRTGVTIPNFNDANSAWPASLAGSPCMGYFEAS